MSRLGIYFGPNAISILETNGRQIINYIVIPCSEIAAGTALEEKVPQEIKTFTLIKNELSNRGIESKEATVILSGKDLIVRTFEIPLLPREELYSAVNFEVKKYIPFKIEDLVWDFQYKLDKVSRKIYVLFVGIKRETMDEYVSILADSGLKLRAIEYSAFSLLRLLNLTRVKEKGVIAVINMDLKGEDENNFVVLDKGFPLFSRDITFFGASGETKVELKEDIDLLKEELPDTADIRAGTFLEKLKREIMVTLHYYDRKFPGKSTSKIFFIMNQDYRPDLLEAFRDIGLGLQFIDIKKYLTASGQFSLGLVKAYSGSLLGVATEVKINLLSVKERLQKEQPGERLGIKLSSQKELVSALKNNAKLIAASFLICMAIFLYGIYRSFPFTRDLNKIMGQRPQISEVSPTAGYEELTDLFYNYKGKINTLDKLIKKPLRVTELLDTLPRIMPQGIWLSSLNFTSQREDDTPELNLEGKAYLGDSSKEINLVNTFLSNIKDAPVFVKFFKEINLASLNRRSLGEGDITYFVINCSNK